MTIKIGHITANYDDHMGSDLSVVNAARQSFNKRKTVFDDKDKGLIEFLATGMRTKEWDAFLDDIIGLAVQAKEATTGEAGNHAGDITREILKEALIAYKRKAQHWAPFAHPHATINIRIPIFLARQLVKHQIGGTWSEESRRYISDEVEYYFEPVLHHRPDDIKQGAHGVHSNSDGLLTTMKALTETADATYSHLLSQKVAPEEAREILTLNSMTGVTWTGSLLFWARMVTQRVDPHAQLAAQRLARQVDAIMRPLYPVSWEALVGKID